MSDKTHFDSEDDHHTGCRNVNHCQQQQSYSGLRSPGRSNSTYFLNDSWVQTFHIIIIVSTISNNFVFMVTTLSFIIYYFQKKVRGEFTFFLFHLKCWRKISTRIG